MLVEWGFLALLLVLFWAVAMRPARKQRENMARMQDGLEVGDEVVTSSGIYGSVHQLADTRIGLEIAPGVVIEMSRQAVVRKVSEQTDLTDSDEPSEDRAESSDD